METTLTNFFVSHLHPGGYYALFLVTFLETSAFVGLLVPSESIVVIAGLLAARGNLDLTAVIGIAIMGAVLGDTVGYFIGSRFGESFFLRWGHRFFFITSANKHIKQVCFVIYMVMEKTDARTYSPDAQHQIRRQIIRLRGKGFSNRVVAEGVGISESHASTIWQCYKKEGIKAIKPGRRGRRTGAQRTLSPDQETEIQKALIDKTPDQMKLPFALWTRDAVKLLIDQCFGIDMPIRTVGEYLKRWGFTPQKPVKRAYEQSSEAVKGWLDRDYPTIAFRAKEERAEIHWGDETGIQTGANRVRGFAPKGETPVIRMVARKSHVSMISTITNGGKVRFMMYRDAMNSELLIKFMIRLIKDADRKVFLILDNLRVHHSKKVTKWLEEHNGQVEVFYLPSYSPELNPDEYLNGNLKNKVHSGTPIRNREDLEKKTRSFMRTLIKRPAHVRSYFKHQKVAYAA